MPYSRSQRAKQSPGVRTTMALLITVVPPTHAACTTGHSARSCVTSAPQSANRSRIAPYVVHGIVLRRAPRARLDDGHGVTAAREHDRRRRAARAAADDDEVRFEFRHRLSG